MNANRRGILIGVLWTALSGLASAQIVQVASVINGFGGRASGGAYMQVSAGAQPGSVGVSYEAGPANYDGGLVHRAGFLNRFVLFPGLDTNGNGLPDELDPDNDGDGLWDHWEVTGEKFNPATPTDPNSPDSGGAGVPDFDAMVAGVNPFDPDAVFRIIALERDGAQNILTWRARGNNERIYVVRAIDDSYAAMPDTVIWSNRVAGGEAPWYQTDPSIGDPAVEARFYAVEVIQP